MNIPFFTKIAHIRCAVTCRQMQNRAKLFVFIFLFFMTSSSFGNDNSNRIEVLVNENVITKEFPGVPRCFVGTPSDDFKLGPG